MPIARRIESAFDATLTAGTSLKIDFNQLLRADTTARYEAYKTGIEAGISHEGRSSGIGRSAAAPR